MVYESKSINNKFIGIMIIDDDPNIIKCTNRLIASHVSNDEIKLITSNNNAEMVSSNQSAYSFILENLPDIVVVDINLHDGYSTGLVKKCVKSELNNLKKIKWIVYSSLWHDPIIKFTYNSLGVTKGAAKTDCKILIELIQETIEEIKEGRTLIF